MKFYCSAAGVAALLAAAGVLSPPSSALATTGSSIQAAQYCIVTEAQSYRKALPIFGNSSSCVSWKSASLVSAAGRSATASVTPSEVAQLPPGSHTLYLRFQDDLGSWGPPRGQRFRVVGPKSITAGSYFIDSDGDPTAGSPLPPANLLSKGGWKLATDPALAPGPHTLRLYLQDSTGAWGSRRFTFSIAAKPTVSTGRFFVILPDTLPAAYLASLAQSPNVNLASQGRPLSGTLNTASVALSGLFTPPPILDYGIHTAYALFMDSNKSWTKGWLDPAGTPEVPRTTVYVGNRLSVTATDSDGSHAGRDGSVQVSAANWPGTNYATPALSCTSASLNCTDVYPNGAILTFTATPKPWIDKTPVWTGCSVQVDGSCQVSMDAVKSVSLKFVDSVPPDTTVNGGPGQLVNISSASFGFTLASASTEDSNGLSFRCQLDGDPTNDATFTACAAPKAFASLAEGQHTFYVKAVDKAGNKDASPASYSWTVDLTPPTITTFAMPATSTTLTVAVGSLLATDNLAVTGYLITQSSAVPTLTVSGWSATPPVDYTFGSDGSKTLYAWARDAAGNVSASLSATVSVDTAQPNITSFSLPTNSNSLTVAVSLIATDNVAPSGYLVSESASAPSAASTGWSVSAPPTYTFGSAGSKTLYAWARDAAGNVSTPASASTNIVIRAGDCDGNGTVTIAEVQSVINMYLGMKEVAGCIGLDISGTVSIAEVQKVINEFLGL
jgi:hypothetical protein